MRKVNQDYPVNTEDYPDLIDEDKYEDQQNENEVAEEEVQKKGSNQFY